MPVVIVTGGASGIGLACAQLLAEEGHRIAIWDIDAAKAESAASSISNETGGEIIGLGVDVAKLEQITNAIESTRAKLGKISGLVHAAGVTGVSPI